MVVIDAAALDALGPAEQDALTSVVASTSVRLHARLHARADQISAEVTRLAEAPHVSGVVLVLPAAHLDVLGRELLPALAAAGLVAPPGPDATTLRARLGIPRRTDPDLSTSSTAFPAVSLSSKESA